MDVAEKPRGSRVSLIAALLAGGVLVLFVAGLWLFSAKEYKAPPARVVPIPTGFDLVGEDADGGSGGTTVRWVFIDAPDGFTAEQGIAELQTVMEQEGWVPSASPPDCCVQPGTFGLVRRNDEWAAFESAESISAWTYDLLDLGDIDTPGVELIVVELNYTDWGVGRRILFN